MKPRSPAQSAPDPAHLCAVEHLLRSVHADRSRGSWTVPWRNDGGRPSAWSASTRRA